MPSLHRFVAVVLLASALAIPRLAVAQDHDHPQPDWIVDVGVAGANALSGAVTAAVTAAIRGDAVPEAFIKGAVGGAAVFAGKRVAVEQFSGAGLLGRQVGSVGASIVANGGAGRGWVEEVWLPLGPVWLQASPSSDFGARLDLLNVGVTAWAVERPELEVDGRRSLDSGALVFTSPGHRITNSDGDVNGVAMAGTIALGAMAPIDVDVVERHERVHVIQYDYFVHTVSRPFEKWGWDRLLGRRMPFDLGLIALAGTPRFVRDLTEAEAGALELR